MGSVATTELAGAVASAGALGMIGGVRLPAAFLAGVLDQLSDQVPRSVGVNFLMPFLDRECVEIASAKVRVVEFFYGDPDPGLVQLVHTSGALACWQVGSIEEAKKAQDAGCDLIVAQGVEAGGHVRGRIGLLALLDQVLGAVEVPVVAAGGIGTSRAMAAALAAGADAVRVGTRFVAAAESAAHPRYQEALIRANAEDSILTEAFSVMWPGAPHRVLRSAVKAADACQDEFVGETIIAGSKLPLPRFSVPSPTRAASGKIEAMALYAGESVGAVRSIQPAAQIVKELADGAEQLLRRWGS
jgi:nitronate monooxygenase